MFQLRFKYVYFFLPITNLTNALYGLRESVAEQCLKDLTLKSNHKIIIAHHKINLRSENNQKVLFHTQQNRTLEGSVIIKCIQKSFKDINFLDGVYHNSETIFGQVEQNTKSIGGGTKLDFFNLVSVPFIIDQKI